MKTNNEVQVFISVKKVDDMTEELRTLETLDIDYDLVKQEVKDLIIKLKENANN